MGKPCRSRHPDFAAGCRACWLARHDARYRRLWGIPGDPEPVPPGSEFRPAAPARPRAGYGDAVAWLTGKLGLKPCGGCKKRRDKLNRLPTPGELWRKLWRRHG